MIAILTAILSRIGFTFLSIYWKFFRDQGISTQAILGFSAVATLPWVAVTFYLFFKDSLNLNSTYLFYSLSWLGIVCFSQFIPIFLLKYQSLTASDSFRIVFSTILALAVDIVLFQTVLSPFILWGCVFLLIGALVLQVQRPHEKISVASISLLSIFVLNMILGAMSIAELALYKAGLEAINNQIIFHTAWSTTLTAVFYILFGGAAVVQTYQSGKFKVKDLLIISCIMAGALICYTYAVGVLPLVVMALVRVVGSGIFAVFDLKFKEFEINNKTITALIIILVGFALITFGKIN